MGSAAGVVGETNGPPKKSRRKSEADDHPDAPTGRLVGCMPDARQPLRQQMIVRIFQNTAPIDAIPRGLQNNS